MENMISEDRLAELESEVNSCVNGEYSIEKLAIRSVSLLPELLKELKITRKMYFNQEAKCTKLNQDLSKEIDKNFDFKDLDSEHYELTLKYKDLSAKFEALLMALLDLNSTFLSSASEIDKIEQCKQTIIKMCDTLEEIKSKNWEDRRWMVKHHQNEEKFSGGINPPGW